MIQIKKCLNSFGYAANGIRECFKSENNFRVHTIATVSVILLGAWVKLSRWEWCVLLITISMVLACELVNTAVEKLVDLVSPNFNPDAGAVKDVAAGAVLVVSTVAVIIGIIIFFPYMCL